MTEVAVNQSVLAPAGGPAFLIHGLWLLVFWVCVAVFFVVLAAVTVAVVRGTRRRFDSPSSETALSRGVAGAVGLTVATLMILLVASISTGRAVATPQASNAVSVEVIGHQWWWEVQYEDTVPS